MSWASSCAELPIAVSRAGGLGVVAAGPLAPEAFRDIVRTVKASLGEAPFAVNIPLTRGRADEILDVSYDERAPIVIASQGSPKPHVARFRGAGVKWLHVVASIEHARKAAAAGVDGLVVVGAEAGGHPPPNEVGTLVLVRRVAQELSMPLIAGGGVADGYGVAALLALGADAVQLGTRFLLTHEANVHGAYQDAVVAAEVDGTTLVGRRGQPIRALKNAFAARVADAERDNVSAEEYETILRSSTLKQAALDGDVEWGKVEAGQSAGLIGEILPAAEVMRQLVTELVAARDRLVALGAPITPVPSATLR
jgi:enoyl-[acyl-carrier protein] reductase II